MDRSQTSKTSRAEEEAADTPQAETTEEGEEEDQEAEGATTVSTAQTALVAVGPHRDEAVPRDDGAEHSNHEDAFSNAENRFTTSSTSAPSTPTITAAGLPCRVTST